MIRFQEFYKKRGVRNPAFFSTPPVSSNKFLALPQGSVYHYTDHGKEYFGEDDPIIEQLLGKTCVQNVYGLSVDAVYGKKHRTVFNQTSQNQHFYQEHKQYMRYAQAAHILPKSPMILHIANYMHIEAGVDYMPEILRDYHAYLNRWISIFSNISSIMKTDHRQHFLRINVPTHIPPVSAMKKCANMFPLNHTLYQEMPDQDELLLLELWKWFDIEKEQSDKDCMFDFIDSPDLDRLNIVFVVGQHWSVYNLGMVKSWIKTVKNPTGKYMPDQIRRKFLGLLINLSNLRHEHSVQTTPDTGNFESVANAAKAALDLGTEEHVVEDTMPSLQIVEQTQSLTEMIKTTVSPNAPALGVTSGKKSLFYQKAEIPQALGTSIGKAATDTSGDDDFVDADVLNEDAADSDLDASLEELENLHKVKMNVVTVEAIGYKAYTPQSHDHASSVAAKVDEYASKGLLSASQAKRLKTLGNRYKTVKTYRGETIEEAINIPPESLLIPQDVKIVPDHITGMLDQSMRYSSLKRMDSDYIKHTMHRDVYSAVMAFQKAGIAVKDVKVTHTDDLLNDHYTYTVHLAPTLGIEGPVKFTIPNLKSDGTFVGSGTEYRMRKQHVDIPFRKVKPDEVSMTSDMKKIFVTRSDQVVNDYSTWLIKQVNNLSLEENPKITDVHYGDVFNQYLEVPRQYSAMARSYSEFRVGEYHFWWDMSKNAERYPGVTDLKNGEIPCGFSSHGTLVMDRHGYIHVLLEKGGMEVIGDFEHLLGIDSNKAPMDVIEMEVFGKRIPVGLLLGYYLGLGNLLKTLNTKVRRVNKGQSMKLESWEFAVRFSDETLIVNKHDQVSAMLLSGFNRFASAVKEHSIYSFDKPDVYKAVWYTKDIGTRFYDEFDLQRSMWVDPLTHDLLVELNLPTDFVLLLIKAATVLTDDRHPDEMDEEFLRIRGYERIAGMVYSQVVDSVRKFQQKGASTKAQVSMHPDEVWYNIVQDQTAMPVDRSNPIQSMKDQEVVVFSGKGGRSSQTLTGSARKMHRNSSGVISPDTVDNGETGAIVYMTANPNITSVRGRTRRIVNPGKEPARLLSPSVLFVPGAEFDD